MNKIRFLTSPLRVFPDFIIAGEAKCGTTSLYKYLIQHPSILTADVKEPNNFRNFGGSPMFCKMHYPLRTQMLWTRLRQGKAVTGEASAEYFSKPELPPLIAELLPRVKIIIMLRNPADRAYSDWQMLSRAGREPRSFPEVVDQSLAFLETEGVEPILQALDHLEYHPLRTVLRGLYIRPLLRWMEAFPAEQIHVGLSEDLFKQTEKTLASLYDFLGLPAPSIPLDLTARKRGTYQEALPEDLRQRLTAFFRPWNQQLALKTGLELTWDASEP